jgi:hypothetical protein
MKQTAVEWLEEQMDNLLMDGYAFNSVQANELYNQAKEMEKNQIIDARQDGHDSTYAEYGETPKCYIDGSNEQYYNEIFKKI